MKSILKNNYKIILCLLFFMFISILSIYSSEIYNGNHENLYLKQLVWYLIGWIIVILIIKIKKKKLYKNVIYIYIILNILLLGLLFFGTEINGSKCWYTFSHISIQPSEFMKPVLVIILSININNFLNKKKEKRKIKNFISLIKIGLILIIPSILTFLEPDTGAVFIYIISLITLISIIPTNKKWILIILIFTLLISILIFYLYFYNKNLLISIFGNNIFYRIKRIFDWKTKNNFQLKNSLIAIGSSNFFGHGFKNMPIYLPESNTDFIFSVYTSCFGFFGSIIFLIITLYFDIQIIKIAKNNKKRKNKYIIIGITSIIIFQQIYNISMTIGLLPIMGITLPFISYGGSSIISNMFSIGIILSLNIQK